MKTLLLCFNVYFILNLISALDTFNPTLQQQHIHPHEYGEMINDETNNHVVQQNPSQFQRGKYNQLQENLSNPTQINAMNNNRHIHPKFRPWPPISTNNKTQLSLLKTSAALSNLDISSIIQNDAQLNEPSLLEDEKLIVNTTQFSALLQLFTTKPQVQERISFVDYFFQRQLRSIFGHHHDKLPSRTRSYIKTGLR